MKGADALSGACETISSRVLTMTREKGPTVITQKGPTWLSAGVTEGARRATEVTPAKAGLFPVHFSFLPSAASAAFLFALSLFAARFSLTRLFDECFCELS